MQYSNQNSDNKYMLLHLCAMWHQALNACHSCHSSEWNLKQQKTIAVNLDLRIFQILNVSSQAGYPYQYNKAQLTSKFECTSQIRNKKSHLWLRRLALNLYLHTQTTISLAKLNMSSGAGYLCISRWRSLTDIKILIHVTNS